MLNKQTKLKYQHLNMLNKTKSRKIKNTNKKPKKNNYYTSNDGMLTTIWGPTMWHFLHTISFNYPIKPTSQDKKKYKQFVLNLQYVLPCKYCRKNFKKNLKIYPLKKYHLENRETFSKYIYNLHEIVNLMLRKQSGLSYYDVRDRYEYFRSRCDAEEIDKLSHNHTENGCTEPLYGTKTKCVLTIVPQRRKCKTLTIDKECLQIDSK